MKRRVHLYLSLEAKRNFDKVAKLRGESLSAAAEHLFRRVDPERLKLKPRRPTMNLGRCPRSLSDSSVFAVRDRFSAGHPMRRIAADFGVSLATIQRAVHGTNNYRYARRRGPKPLPVSVVERIRERKNSQSYRKLSADLAREGIYASPATLKKVVDKVGAYRLR